MPPSVAAFLFAVGIAALFYLDREPEVPTSKALWIAIFWIWIVCSRSVTDWLGMNTGGTANAAQLAEGSPVDAAFFGLVELAAIVTLCFRSRRAVACIKANWPVMLYFGFCLVSLAWSDFASVGFKRWTKGLGDLAVVMVVVTDPQPAAALRRFLARAGFILLPLSVLLIKYYSALGRGYDQWGYSSITGVTTNKNLLGVTNLVLTMGAAWRVLVLLRDKKTPNRLRHLVAQGVLLGTGLLLFVQAQSATAGASFALGTALMFLTQMPFIARRPSAVHKLVLFVVVAGAILKLSGAEDAMIHAMGRKSDFTGRTGIWQTVIPMCPNPLVGAGYESFWLGPRLLKVWAAFPVFLPNEAHNGYIEIYLELGFVGLAIMGTVLFYGYWCSVATFRRDPAIGSLMLAYIVVSVIYSITEAGFRQLDPMWVLLLLAVVMAGRYANLKTRKKPRTKLPADAEPLPIFEAETLEHPAATLPTAYPMANSNHLTTGHLMIGELMIGEFIPGDFMPLRGPLAAI